MARLPQSTAGSVRIRGFHILLRDVSGQARDTPTMSRLGYAIFEHAKVLQVRQLIEKADANEPASVFSYRSPGAYYRSTAVQNE